VAERKYHYDIDIYSHTHGEHIKNRWGWKLSFSTGKNILKMLRLMHISTVYEIRTKEFNGLRGFRT